MTTFTSFSRDKARIEDRIGDNNKMLSGTLIMFLTGLALVILAVGFAIPTDLFSSARWYDASGIRLVFESESGFLANVSQHLPQKVSLESTVFALLLFFGQIMLGIKAAMAGSWILDDSQYENVGLFRTLILIGRGDVVPEKLNAEKATHFIMLVLLVALDTFTDTDWKLTESTANPFLALALSIFYNNLGSEWALVEGFRRAWAGGRLLWLGWRGEITFTNDIAPQTNQRNNKQRGNNNRQQANHHQHPSFMPPTE